MLTAPLLLLVLYFSSRLVHCKSNFVIFLTDDQDVTLGGLNPMKKTLDLIKAQGATFVNAFTTTPICCPSRASFLTGFYQHNHNVVNNTVEGNCSSVEWQKNFEENTFASYLKDIGYQTFYAGKYMNQYGHKSAGGAQHVPKGWDTWVGLVGNSVYYNYSLSINGVEKYVEQQYLTTLIKNEAIKFLSNVDKRPFLMVIAPPAPHAPFTPEQKYNGTFVNQKIPREPHFNIADNHKKHWFVRMKPAPLSDSIVRNIDRKFSERWETLLSVDDLVEEVIMELDRKEQLKKTYVFYTSDNGFHLGQFSMPWDKRQMYEFDIRVPMLVRGPGIKKNVTVKNPILLIDIAPTLLSLAGSNAIETDGVPFLPVEKRSDEDYGRSFLIEYQGERSNHNEECPQLDSGVSNCKKEVDCKCQDAANNTYSCIRSYGPLQNTIYCQFSDHEKFEEAYDLNLDPYQLDNRVFKIPEVQKQKMIENLHVLKSCKKSDCHLQHEETEPVLSVIL